MLGSSSVETFLPDDVGAVVRSTNPNFNYSQIHLRHNQEITAWLLRQPPRIKEAHLC